MDGIKLKKNTKKIYAKTLNHSRTCLYGRAVQKIYIL